MHMPRVAQLCAELGITPQALAGLRAAAHKPDKWLTVEEICAELKVSRRAFGRWRATGTRRSVEEVLDHRKADNVRASEVDFGRGADTWPAWTPDRRDAILQAPRPAMPPSRAVMERAAELEAEH